MNDQGRDYSHPELLGARIRLHTECGTNPMSWWHWIYDRMDLKPQQAVLELGSGSGELWQENATRLPQGVALTLTDISQPMLRVSRNNLRAVGITASSTHFVVANAERLPFDDASFDKVVAVQMLFHISDRKAAFSEIRRVLVPGGRLYASTNGLTNLQELDDLAERYVPQVPRDRTSEEFGLENGRAQLAPFFSQIAQHDYPDELIVNNPRLIIDYIASMVGENELGSLQRAELNREITREIRKSGSFRIKKSSGMFVAG